MSRVLCWVNGSMTAVLGSGTRSMSDSWISWNPRIEDPSKPTPSSNTSAVSCPAGMEKCCISPGRSQNRTSTISMPSSPISCSTSSGVRSSTIAPFSVVRGLARPDPLARYMGPETRCGRGEGRLAASPPRFPSTSDHPLPIASARQRRAAAVNEEAGHDIRIAVGVGPAILDVPLPVHLDLPRDADRRAAVGHAEGELVPWCGLVEAGEAPLDVGPVAGHVLRSLGLERLDRGHHGVVALPHGVRREVGMGAGAVP